MLKRNRHELLFSEIREIQVDKKDLLIITKYDQNIHIIVGKKTMKKILHEQKDNLSFSGKIREVDKIKVELN